MRRITTSQGASLVGESGTAGGVPASGGEPAGPDGLDGLGLLGRAGMVAVRVADLASPARHGLGKDGRTALTAAGAGRIGTGDLVVFCKPVAIAPAVVRRDGRVQAAGHPAGHARLGAAEARLDALCGRPGVIDEVAAGVTLTGRVTGQAVRAMTAALAVRLVLLMTLLPGAGYAEVLDALLGDLPLVPWQRPYQVPTPAVVCTWRQAIGPGPLQRLRDLALAGIDAEHRGIDYPAVAVGNLDLCAIDGSLLRAPDTPANRAAFGSTGTADGSAPFPQLRELRCTHAATRAALAVVTGPSGAGEARDKGEAEQKLLDDALQRYPDMFTDRRCWVMDRNFPGVGRISKMLEVGTHVLIRVKSDIPLRRTGPYAPDGSYLAELCGGGSTLTVRVIEYLISVEGGQAPELFCLITDLTDHHTYPADVLAAAYHWRWIGSETALKEAKSTITGSGPSTGPMLRSQSPDLIAQEHAAWLVATELARALARDAAAAPARTGRRPGLAVHPREISFTAARRTITATTRTGAATASLPAPLIAANRDRALDRLARSKITVDRHRHRDRKIKARPAFGHGGPVIPTRTAPARINVCTPLTA